MPQPDNAVRDATPEEEAAALLASREKFGAGFRRSQSGNLTQRLPHLDDPTRLVRLTVFRRWQRFHWVMHDGADRPRTSADRTDYYDVAPRGPRRGDGSGADPDRALPCRR